MKREYFKIGEAAISITNIRTTLNTIHETLTVKETGYVCVTNSRSVYMANLDPDFRKIQNGSLLSVPDGMPLVWIARNKGYKEVGKVSGKDLMDAIFGISVEQNYSHFFYGSTLQTLDRLRENVSVNYPGMQIAGTVSPPFQPLEEFDIDALAQRINLIQPTFFWCGLGAPKQERFIYMLQPKLNSTICIGVGLAFEYFAGTVKRAPEWMIQSGLEWVYRLAQQPKKIQRAFRPLSWIFVQLMKSKFRK